MDNKKIGKLIASLRRKNGLTQQELGDKVGVGFRAVSKWERGINLPDIGIINDLSKTLGISSDELLTGELKKDNGTKEKKKLSLSIKITITSIIAVILIFTGVIINYNNKVYTYDMTSEKRDEYVVEGKVVFEKNKLSIIINELVFVNSEFSSTIVTNYEYKLISNDTYLFGYGYLSGGKVIDEGITIKKIAENFSINYSDITNLKRKEVVNNNLYLIIDFIDENNQTITKEIEILLIKTKDKS